MLIPGELPAGHVVAAKYRVKRPIGAGGMGAVYEAENIWTERRVALKLLRPDMADNAEVLDRFVQEGRSATMIAHPNVVEVLDMGRDADGAIYMVQEYLQGSRLDALRLKRGRLPVRDALDLIVPVMGGLVAAHQRGIVHRDVKPENIIITQSARGRLTPKLIDFGVAKLIGHLRAHQTQPGMVMGTPYYMAPEQLSASGEADHRVDIWAIAVVLYELLAGRRPVDAVGLPAIWAAVVKGTPPPLQDLAPETPPALAAAVHRALAKVPADRFSSMEAFVDGLLGCAGLEPIAAWVLERHPEALPYRRRHHRFDVHWHCELSCPQWKVALQLVSANFSAGGLFLASSNPPALGTAAEIGLTLPDGSHVRLRGRVLRIVGVDAAVSGGTAGFALRFDEEHATELAVLEQIAAAHEAPGYQALPAHGPPPPPAEVVGGPPPAPTAGAPRSSAPTAARVPQAGGARLPPSADTMPGPTKPASGAAADRGPTRPRVSAAPREPLAEAVGIDFGTSYSSVSIALGDKVYVIPDGKERTLHPSLVAYPARGQPIVGWDARQQQVAHPERTVASVKRLLGRSINDPALQGFLRGLAFPAVAGPNESVVLRVGEAELAPVQVAAEIIEFLRRTAEARTGRALRQAVLSVPLTFSEVQRQAIKRAATMAGVEVLELIGEPIAAVLAYGFGQGKQETVAVYDFGGGTFDFSVAVLHGNRHRVLASGGDPWLGGDDFDLALAQGAANRFWRESKVDLRQRAVEWQRLLFASEHAKRMLSTQEQTELVLAQAIAHPQPRDLRWSLTRKELEELCADAVAQSLEVCRRTLASIKLAPEKIDRVVITGGTARIPFVQRELSRFFGRPLAVIIDPELSVCVGAGLRAAVLTRHRVKQGAHRSTAS
ncbi:MAG: Hsp70 family protein [Proteobacteria bacterium]|nr:Hsp70 family protein [Pseudomonadota bacterium]